MESRLPAKAYPDRLKAGLRTGPGRFEIWILVTGVLFLSGSVGFTAEPSSFRTGILPILTKAGCNAGACHGAATGQGGFKLSLLGYDPEEDHQRITRELSGRRIDVAAPAESLFLQKPSQQIEHEGGRRLPRGSVEYEKLLDWLQSGAPFGPADLRVTQITVSPADSLFPMTNQTTQLRVTALLSDGSREDVTKMALYASNDDAIAEVGKTGEIVMRGRGLTSVMVRYSGQVAAARMAVPFADSTTPVAKLPVQNFIDEHIGAELQRLRLPASELSSDSEFLRRVYLDLTGRLPSARETRDFIAAPSAPSARQSVIEGLLEREEFVDFWTMRFADLLLISGRRGSDAATRAYHHWLRQQVAANTPFDQITRALLTAEGALRSVGPANFFTLAKDPRDLAEHVGRMFLGSQIACARCHAHPADRWTQEDYHRFAAYFARVVVEGDAVMVSTRGEVELPKTGRPVSPKPLGPPVQKTAASNSKSEIPEDRRVELAAWLTAPENPLFAHTLVNRVWKHLLGRGLVEPVDDLRPTNPPTHPALLDALAADFVANGHDLRRLIRTIASSQTYQLTSRANGLNALDDRFYSHAYRKELPAQVFVDAVAQVTGVPDRFGGPSGNDRMRMAELAEDQPDAYPEGTRAVQLIGARTPSYALDVLGRCSREGPCDVSGGGGGLAEALHLINGTTINEKLKGGVVDELMARSTSDGEIIEELYLRALARRPAKLELNEWAALLARAGNKREAVEDLLWTLLNSREFAFNH